MWIKKGVKLLEETLGEGDAVRRQGIYIIAIRISLSKGEVIETPQCCLSFALDDYFEIYDDGYLESRIRFVRHSLLAGIFYAVDGMKIGGYRKVAIAPHLAYRERGIPGIIPENAKIIAEVKIIRECD